MKITDLARLLMSKKALGITQTALKLGVSRQVLARHLNQPEEVRRRDFGLKVVALAFSSGLEAEAMSVLLGQEVLSSEVSTAFKAAMMYPDLKSSEMEMILKTEEAVKNSSLPVDMIRSIIEISRSPKP